MKNIRDYELVLVPDTDENAVFRVELAGITYPNPDYKIRRDASNPIYVLEYIESGMGHLHFGGKEYTPEAGDVYFLQPQVEHEYYSDRTDPWKKLWFNVSGPLIDALTDAYSLRGHVFFPNMEHLKKEFEHGHSLIREKRRGYFRELALVFHRILSELSGSLSKADCASKAAEQMKMCIQDHWRQGVSLAELANSCGRSPSQALRIFQKEWKTTPYAYLQQIRRKIACQYLENTQEPIKNVASLCGFKDEFYFSNWFRTNQGMPPSLYRKNFRKIPAEGKTPRE